MGIIITLIVIAFAVEQSKVSGAQFYEITVTVLTFIWWAKCWYWRLHYDDVSKYIVWHDTAQKQVVDLQQQLTRTQESLKIAHDPLEQQKYNDEREARRRQQEQETRHTLRRQRSTDRQFAIGQQYGHAEFRCREDAAFVRAYAEQHHTLLLNNRAQITAAYAALHDTTDNDGVSFLRDAWPDVYLRIWEVFQWRCLAAADSLPASQTKTKPTPEEYRQKQAQHIKDQSELAKVRKLAVQDAINLFRKELDTDARFADLTENEKQDMANDYERELSAQGLDHGKVHATSNGNIRL